MRKQYFSSFCWAMPFEFSDALNRCCFEEGDIFYSSKVAYEKPWETVRDKGYSAIQVRAPARSTAPKGGAVFDINWGSEVSLDLFVDSELSKSIVTKQGNLYTALWKGDIKALETDLLLSVPFRLKHVMANLKKPNECLRSIAKGNLAFVLLRDMANPVSKAKYQKVSSVLAPYLRTNAPNILSVKDAGLSDSELIAPTIDVAFFALKDLAKDGLVEVIKSAVYIPAKGSKTSRFRLASHGLIID